MSDIKFEVISLKQGHAGFITLNRPEQLNALTPSMIIELWEHLLSWKNDSSIQFVLIQAVPGKAFCAGGDIRKVYQMKSQNIQEGIDFFWHEYRLNYLIKHYPKPYVALIDGINMGGGVGISLHGSLRIATENCLFAMPETAIGFFPDVGGTYLLSHLPKAIGMYLGLTGARLKSPDLHFLNLIDYVVPSQQLYNVVDNLMRFSHSDEWHSYLRTLNKTEPLEYKLASEVGWINQAFESTDVESLMVTLKENKHALAQTAYESMKAASPTSLKVTFEALRRGRQLSFDECLKMEYRLVNHFLNDHDFYEGVRALLVDKDKNPQWKPSRLEEVNEERVNLYFQSVAGKKLIFN